MNMVAYEFYWRNEIGEAHLVGILPERRRDPNRITDESVINWVKKVIGDSSVVNDIYFLKVNVEEDIGSSF
ncbi:MAG: hypothetical protein FJ123_15545 [Deltaproteobacteria bacterium]|nr:hypothetical protein [Deltaproteobacteria bacterium]